MSSALMIFIGEHEKFDFSSTVQAISSMKNIENVRIAKENLTEEGSIGFALEADYRYDDNDIAPIHFARSLDFISAQHLGKASLEFALKLQSLFDVPLTATDTNYSFQAKLKNIASLQELENIMCSDIYME